MGYNMLYLQFVDLPSSVFTHLSPTHNNNPTGKVNVHRVCIQKMEIALRLPSTLLILNIPSATIIPEIKIFFVIFPRKDTLPNAYIQSLN